MILKKWNYEKQEYEDYEVPDEYKIKVSTADLEETINCADCGKQILYGNSFRSREIKSNYGFNYAICIDCHKKELGNVYKDLEKDYLKINYSGRNYNITVTG